MSEECHWQSRRKLNEGYMLGGIVRTLKQVLKREGLSRYRLQKESGITCLTLQALYHGESRLYSAKVQCFRFPSSQRRRASRGRLPDAHPQGGTGTG